MAINEQSRAGNPADEPRDPRLAAFYREAAREEPPGSLDAAILAAAHREVGARPRSAGASWLRSWRLPLSIAAVVVVSVSLVTLMLEEDAEQLTAPAPGKLEARSAEQAAQNRLPAPATPAESVPFPAPTREEPAHAQALPMRESAPARPAGVLSAPKPVTEDAARADSGATPGKGDAAGSVDVPSDIEPLGLESGALGPAKSPPAAAEDRRQPAPRIRAERAPAETAAVGPDPKPAPRKSVLLREFESQPPEKWLERIVELRREGRIAESDEFLAEFRKRFPHHPLPPALR